VRLFFLLLLLVFFLFGSAPSFAVLDSSLSEEGVGLKGFVGVRFLFEAGGALRSDSSTAFISQALASLTVAVIKTIVNRTF